MKVRLREVEKPVEFDVMPHPLIKAWKTQRLSSPPYALDTDNAGIPAPMSVVIGSFQQMIQCETYLAVDSKFHLGLLPVPFIGDLEKADIYIGLLNPGLDMGLDYYVESTRSDFCRVLRRNLRQELGSEPFPFFPLDPKWCWTGTGRWWHRLLRDMINRLIKTKSCSYIEATRILAKRIAALELVPYHSTDSRYISQCSRRFKSSELMRLYVNEVVIPRTKRADALLVLTRGIREWGIPKGRNVKIYNRFAARSASLSQDTLGGKAILKRLLRKHAVSTRRNE